MPVVYGCGASMYEYCNRNANITFDFPKQLNICHKMFMLYGCLSFLYKRDIENARKKHRLHKIQFNVIIAFIVIAYCLPEKFLC